MNKTFETRRKGGRGGDLGAERILIRASATSFLPPRYRVCTRLGSPGVSARSTELAEEKREQDKIRGTSVSSVPPRFKGVSLGAWARWDLRRAPAIGEQADRRSFGWDLRSAG